MFDLGKSYKERPTKTNYLRDDMPDYSYYTFIEFFTLKGEKYVKCKYYGDDRYMYFKPLSAFDEKRVKD
jgi:hypothetical protein